MKYLRIRKGTVVGTFHTTEYKGMTLEQMRAFGMGIPHWIIGRIENETIWNYPHSLLEFLRRAK
jgi:hypothetical protein